nr:MAG TPA: hypothetical protein [Caudoviricetes sp.]
MEGVRILNEISPMSAGIWVSIGLFIAIGNLSLFIGIPVFDKGQRIVPILVSIIPFIFAVVLFFTEYIKPMKYEAIIDDNVKISEFEKNYKIIEKRGDIYVIEEIERNDE